MEIVIKGLDYQEAAEDVLPVHRSRKLLGNRKVLQATKLLAKNRHELGVSAGVFVRMGDQAFWATTSDIAVHLACPDANSLDSPMEELGLRRTHNPLHPCSHAGRVLERFKSSGSLAVYLCGKAHGKPQGVFLATDMLSAVQDSIDPELRVSQFARLEGALQCTAGEDWSLVVPEAAPTDMFASYSKLIRRLLKHQTKFAVELDPEGRALRTTSLSRIVFAMSRIRDIGLESSDDAGAEDQLDLSKHLVKVRTVSHRESLKTALKNMLDGRYVWLSVVNDEGNYIGTLNAMTIVNALKFQ